ncbi:MAG: hypothetical protein H7Y18_03445 [Clostridiaceae bacterium]|nr:hypothetical protein [Clostridiaceae bacterium]
MKNKEYDEFGPWVLEINHIEDVPKLFKPHCLEIENVLLLLKIPRNIERRNANPDMNLYDYVLAVYEDHLLILKRESDAVEIIEIKFKDIIAIRNSMDLLNGVVTLYLCEKIISFNYSTVSIDIIKKFLKLIRERFTGNRKFIIKNALDNILTKDIDELYHNILEDFQKAKDEFKVLAVQPTIKAIPFYTSRIKKILGLFNIFRRNSLQNIMFLTNEKELLIVTRGKTFRRPKAAFYSYDLTYIPIGRITNLRYDANDEYKNISPFFIETGDHIFQYYFEESNNQGDYLRQLLQL